MIKLYFVTVEDYKQYDDKLKPQERFTNNRLVDLGVKNLMCGEDVIVVAPTGYNISDKDLPAKYWLTVERAGDAG